MRDVSTEVPEGDLIDIFTIMVNYTEPETFAGSFGIATITLGYLITTTDISTVNSPLINTLITSGISNQGA